MAIATPLTSLHPSRMITTSPGLRGVNEGARGPQELLAKWNL